MISVIVPIYNVEAYLVGCLTSIQKQTITDIEVICVDDGSTDSSGRLADEFAAIDNRFHVIHRKNGGLSAARNTGISAAKGEYIFFVDSDDYIHPQALELLLELQKKTKADLVGGILSKTPDIYEKQSFPKLELGSFQVMIFDQPLQAFMKRRDIATGAPFRLYRREILEKIRFVEGIYFEDVPFTTMVMSQIQTFAQIQAPIYYYYQNPASIMRTSFTVKKVKSYDKVIRTIYEYIQQYRPQDLEMVRRVILNGRFKMMVNQAIRKQKDKVVQKELFIAIQKIVESLYQEGVISYDGLKLKHKICLWLLLKNRPMMARQMLKIIP